jgi:hypothetical protein
VPNVLTPNAKQAFLDNNGLPLVGGKLFSYVAGTSTKLATKVSSSGADNANPTILNFRGEADVWLPPNVAYKFVLAPANDTDPPTRPIWTVDSVVASQLVTLYGGVDTGSVNAYVLTFTANFTVYTDGIIIYWIPANSNTDASTVNVNGLGAVPIVNQDGTALRINQIIASNVVGILYKSGNFILLNVNAVGLTPTVNTKNTNYTFLLTDAYNIVAHTDASAYVYTVPADATTNFAVGTSIQVINQSSNTLQISPAGGVNLYAFGIPSLASGSITLSPSTSTYITKTAANTWQQSTLTSISAFDDAYTGTVTGHAANPTGTIFCKRVGNFAQVFCTANIVAVSNSTDMALTGTMPTSFRPSSTRVVISVGMRDNGVTVGGVASIASTGVITFGAGINNNPTGFTAALSKGLEAGWSLIYPL